MDIDEDYDRKIMEQIEAESKEEREMEIRSLGILIFIIMNYPLELQRYEKDGRKINPRFIFWPNAVKCRTCKHVEKSVGIDFTLRACDKCVSKEDFSFAEADYSYPYYEPYDDEFKCEEELILKIRKSLIDDLKNNFKKRFKLFNKNEFRHIISLLK